jgi:hypothetical protein
MGLDIRLPIGMMFSILGPILVVTGLVNGTPLNTYTGSAMLVFGLLMLIFGIAGQKRENAQRAADEKAEEAAKADASREGLALKLVA